MEKKKNKSKEIIVKLDMTFEEAMKKALNTPLPKPEKKNKARSLKNKKA